MSAATFFGFGLTLLGFQASRWALPWEYALVYQALPSAVLNVLLMAAIFPGLRALARRGMSVEEANA